MTAAIVNDNKPALFFNATLKRNRLSNVFLLQQDVVNLDRCGTNVFFLPNSYYYNTASKLMNDETVFMT